MINWKLKYFLTIKSSVCPLRWSIESVNGSKPVAVSRWSRQNEFMFMFWEWAESGDSLPGDRERANLYSRECTAVQGLYMPGQSSVSRGRRESPARPVPRYCDTFSQCRLLYSFRCVLLLILELQVRRERRVGPILGDGSHSLSLRPAVPGWDPPHTVTNNSNTPVRNITSPLSIVTTLIRSTCCWPGYVWHFRWFSVLRQ